MTNFIVFLFFAMLSLAIVWLVLVQILFRALANKHPEIHKRIGSPRGFETQATSSLLSFLLTRKPESLGDRAVLLQTNVMRVLLVVYVAGLPYLSTASCLRTMLPNSSFKPNPLCGSA